MKFTTAGEWVNTSVSVLERFQAWWDANTEERKEFSEEPLNQIQAMKMFCEYNIDVTPEIIQQEYQKVVDKSW